jgi:hypothetical protein
MVAFPALTTDTMLLDKDGELVKEEETIERVVPFSALMSPSEVDDPTVSHSQSEKVHLAVESVTNLATGTALNPTEVRDSDVIVADPLPLTIRNE